MHDAPLLFELVVVMAIGVAAAVGVALLRLPAVAGFMLAGALVGPTGLAIIDDKSLVDTLSEIGVVLLLFTIGLEFSLDRLRRIWKLVAIGGTLQVGLTTLACLGVALALGESAARGVFFGFLVALSSTAIVLRGLSERGEVDAPHGKFTIGALIYQDLCVIPMMLLVPIIGGRAQGSPFVDIVVALGKAGLFVVATLFAGRFLLPQVMARVDRARSREVFLLAVLVFCAGIAMLTAYFGLSLALGAFLAGILLSDSAYGQRAMANVLPLRDVLTSLFFMSLGMLFDLHVVQESPWIVVLLFAGIFFGKGFIATLASIVMAFPARVAWLAGVSLAQFGEFGFVLAKEGVDVGIITARESSLVLAAGILTMFVTPVSMRLAPHVRAGAALLRPLEKLLGLRGIEESEREKLKDHVVVGGYGVGGRLLSRGLERAGVPFLVIDLNADSVHEGRQRGVPIYYGDITSDETLAHAHLKDAHALVLMISDADAAKQALAVARQLAPDVPVYVRARRVTEEGELRRLGAGDVIMEELEAGIEAIARVLRSVGAPVNVLAAIVQDARDELGGSARKAVFPRSMAADLKALADLKVEPLLIRDASRGRGKTIGDLSVRTKTGASIIALRRNALLLEHIDATTQLETGDVIYLAGSRDHIAQAVSLLDL